MTNPPIDDTPLFVAEGSFEIKDRGWTVYTGKCPADFRNRDRAIGFEVCFEGRKRKIKAIETFAKFLGPQVGEPIGIVFEDDEKEPT